MFYGFSVVFEGFQFQWFLVVFYRCSVLFLWVSLQWVFERFYELFFLVLSASVCVICFCRLHLLVEVFLICVFRFTVLSSVSCCVSSFCVVLFRAAHMFNTLFRSWLDDWVFP